MKKIFASFLLIATSVTSSFAQIISERIELQPKEISKDGYFIKKIWLQHYQKPAVTLTNVTVQPVPLIDAKIATAPLTNFDIIMGKELKRPFMFVRIPVYSKQDNQYQLTTAFTINVTETQPTTNQSTAQQPQAKTTAAGSVLATGKWYKIALQTRGIYKIDADFIKNKLNVDPATINPANIRVYGNGGVMLSENNAMPYADDLVENPLQIMDGGDGSFTGSDYFLFYANGTTGWNWDSQSKTFVHTKNLYADSSYYFINFDLGQGARIQNQQNTPTANTQVSSFDYYVAHEEDEVNVGKFGKQWWGDELSNDPGKGTTKTFSFDIGTGADSIKLRMPIGSRSFASSNLYTVKLNGQVINSTPFGAVGVDEASNPIILSNINHKAPFNSTTATIELNYQPAVSSAKGYLDFIEINTRRNLAFAGGQLSFRDTRTIGTGNIAAYTLANANSNTVVWDVTNPLLPIKMNGTLSGSNYVFTQDAAMLHEFIAFDGSQYIAASFAGEVPNQNLHGSGQVDYIIVTAPEFKAVAIQLADFHKKHDNMRTIVATTSEVYNEFSSGSQDIAAIRNFARMFYKRAGNDSLEMPKNLLLFGDASYDYKARIKNNTNFVPTYETAESIEVIPGYCSDDFFAFLDDNENIEDVSIANTMDIGVGRLPVASKDAANAMVSKIINYTSPASLGSWRLNSTIIADNGDGEIHFQDGEIMAGTVNTHSNLYNEGKVYLSAIQTISTPAGDRAPDANKMINDAIFKGTFLMNYNGHGSIYTLSHERILTQDDFNSWKNADKLPMMVTATCEFSRFDNPEAVSAGEKLIIKPDGGVIALLTTTQLVYQYLNRPMNVNFLNAQFQQYGGKWPTFGQAFRYGKNVSYATPLGKYDVANFRKFALLGDPALTPNFPKEKIETEAVLDGTTMQPTDTIKALGRYVISGNVKSSTSNQLLSNFNGRVYVTIFDKPKTVNTIQGNQTFQIQNNIIYKGKATVTNGKFSFVFIAPKDLNYDFGKGKISYYAENGTTDAAGADTGRSIGGYSDNPVIDNDGPIVKAFMNDSLFQNGGITGSNTLLYAQLYDETGINVSGNSIGHDLTAVLDNDIEHPYNINDYYESAPNDFKHGFVNFPIAGLSDGKHTFRIKAWDVNNNSGEGTVDFVVYNGQLMKVDKLMNYPNPFGKETHFLFEHNHPEEQLEVQILIYSNAGTLVKTLRQSFTPSGSRSNEIVWDGTGDGGAQLPAGLYVYKLNLSTPKGIQTTAYQKLIIIR